MQPRQRSLADLDIIAYADSLLPEQTPSVLPPIFKVKTSDEVIFPPFHIEGAFIYYTIQDGMAELRQQIELERATPLRSTIPALPFHELWIDGEQNIRYEPWDEVEDTHKQLARDYFGKAKAAFIVGDFDTAKAHCATAINAFDRMVNPFAILAAIALEEDKIDVANLYTQSVDDFCDPEFFHVLILNLREQLAPTKTETIMHGMKLSKPELRAIMLKRLNINLDTSKLHDPVIQELPRPSLKTIRGHRLVHDSSHENIKVGKGTKH